MKAGLVADLIVAVIIILNIAVCTRMGFIRTILKFFSTILAFSVAVFSATPIANFLDSKFGWGAVVAGWNVPFVSGTTLLKLLVGIAMFVVTRLVCIIVDKILAHLKEKLKAVNIVDRILGTVLGILFALFTLTFAFMLINQMNWAEALSLTADGGGFLAFRLYDFCRTYMFDIFGKIFAMTASSTPKI